MDATPSLTAPTLRVFPRAQVMEPIKAPVFENTGNLKLVGVVAERDVCCGVAAEDRRASEIRVDEIMRLASACCGADVPS